MNETRRVFFGRARALGVLAVMIVGGMALAQQGQTTYALQLQPSRMSGSAPAACGGDVVSAVLNIQGPLPQVSQIGNVTVTSSALTVQPFQSFIPGFTQSPSFSFTSPPFIGSPTPVTVTEANARGGPAFGSTSRVLKNEPGSAPEGDFRSRPPPRRSKVDPP